MSTALVVDDSRSVRLVCRRIVESLGFEAAEAADGQQALAIARNTEDLDLVLLDWNMPVMDGLSFLKALRAEPRAKQPAVIMCTTENDMEHIASALAAGANEYVMKPFTEEIIREKIEGVGLRVPDAASGAHC